jgi:hypothetical protein
MSAASVVRYPSASSESDVLYRVEGMQEPSQLQTGCHHERCREEDCCPQDFQGGCRHQG